VTLSESSSGQDLLLACTPKDRRSRHRAPSPAQQQLYAVCRHKPQVVSHPVLVVGGEARLWVSCTAVWRCSFAAQQLLAACCLPAAPAAAAVAAAAAAAAAVHLHPPCSSLLQQQPQQPYWARLHLRQASTVILRAPQSGPDSERHRDHTWVTHLAHTPRSHTWVTHPGHTLVTLGASRRQHLQPYSSRVPPLRYPSSTGLSPPPATSSCCPQQGHGMSAVLLSFQAAASCPGRPKISC